MLRAFVCSVLLVSLLGCADHSKDYLKQAQVVPQIQVPDGVDIVKQANYYPVPDNVATQDLPPSLIPPGSNLKK